MPAVVQDQWRQKSVEDGAVGRGRLADEAELATRHRECREIVAGDQRRARQRTARFVDIAENQRGFRFGRFSPVVVGRFGIAVRRDQVAGVLGEVAGPFDVAGQESQRRGIDT